jgi:DNA-binding response OmpR family regulator
VVLDLALPRLSGLDLAREMKAHPKTAHVPIVVVTGILGIDNELLEFDCVFPKPISPDELIAAVDSCIPESRRS